MALDLREYGIRTTTEELIEEVNPSGPRHLVDQILAEADAVEEPTSREIAQAGLDALGLASDSPAAVRLLRWVAAEELAGKRP